MSSWRSWLNKTNPSLLDRAAQIPLSLASLGYAIAIRLRNQLYDLGWKKSFKASVPVISVGNLSVGGTGKSPTVAWLAKWFRAHDVRVAILSRGYGQLDDGRNDEALELELKLPDVPHLQNPDRVASSQLATDELEMQVLVLDDGFQHRRLVRDLDIVLIDATDSKVAARLLPAGLRREPLRAIRRAHFVIITRANAVAESELSLLNSRIQKFISSNRIATATHQPQSLLQHPNNQKPLDSLRGKQVLAFCGIGNPTAFFESLKAQGAVLLDQRSWPDHHAYTAEDIQSLIDWHNDDRDAVLLCTVKDWVKIQESSLGGRDLLALEIELKFLSGQGELESLLESCIQFDE
ncbi:MAG: tetraacyldisaccharide 4'-kinase [Pirellulales bacterium]